MSQRPDLSAVPPAVVRSGMTADQYFGMASSSQPQNLIDGLLYLSPPPSEEHEEVVAAVSHALREYARQNGGYAITKRCDCWLDANNVVQPDSGYLVAERAGLVGRFVQGAPDLVIEVLSAGTKAFDEEAKFTLYGKSGVREAWFVDPEAATVTVVNGDGTAWQRERTVPFGEVIPSSIVEVGAANLETPAT